MSWRHVSVQDSSIAERGVEFGGYRVPGVARAFRITAHWLDHGDDLDGLRSLNDDRYYLAVGWWLAAGAVPFVDHKVERGRAGIGLDVRVELCSRWTKSRGGDLDSATSP